MASGVRLARTLLIKHPPPSQYALCFIVPTPCQYAFLYTHCTNTEPSFSILYYVLKLFIKFRPPPSQYALLYCTNTLPICSLCFDTPMMNAGSYIYHWCIKTEPSLSIMYCTIKAHISQYILCTLKTPNSKTNYRSKVILSPTL